MAVEYELSAPRMGAGFKEFFTYNDSLDRLVTYGYDRHPRPAELFGTLVRNLERKLHPEQAEVARDIEAGGEWLSAALCRTGNTLKLLEDPRGICWDEERNRYVIDPSSFSVSGEHEYKLSRLHPDDMVPVVDGEDKQCGIYVPLRILVRALPDFLERVWSRPYAELPRVVQEYGALELPPPNRVVPVQFNHVGYSLEPGTWLGFQYAVSCDPKSGSRGVCEVRAE